MGKGVVAIVVKGKRYWDLPTHWLLTHQTKPTVSSNSSSNLLATTPSGADGEKWIFHFFSHIKRHDMCKFRHECNHRHTHRYMTARLAVLVPPSPPHQALIHSSKRLLAVSTSISATGNTHCWARCWANIETVYGYGCYYQLLGLICTSLHHAVVSSVQLLFFCCFTLLRGGTCIFQKIKIRERRDAHDFTLLLALLIIYKALTNKTFQTIN